MDFENTTKITKKHLKSDPGQNHYLFKEIHTDHLGREFAILADAPNSSKLFRLRLNTNLKSSLANIKEGQWFYLIEQDHITIKQTLDEMIAPSTFVSNDVSVDLNDPELNFIPDFPKFPENF